MAQGLRPQHRDEDNGDTAQQQQRAKSLQPDPELVQYRKGNAKSDLVVRLSDIFYLVAPLWLPLHFPPGLGVEVLEPSLLRHLPENLLTRPVYCQADWCEPNVVAPSELGE